MSNAFTRKTYGYHDTIEVSALKIQEAFDKISYGEMPEWPIGAVSKTVVRVIVPRVRIPLSPPCLALEADSTVFIDHFNIRWIRKVLPILMRTASVPKNRNFCPKNAVFYSITPNHAHCGHSDAHLGSLGFPRFLSASEKIEIFKGSNFYLQHADFRAVLSAVLDIATSLSERRLGPEFLIRPRRRLVFLEFPTITPISKEFGMSMKLISIRKSLRQLRRNMK